MQSAMLRLDERFVYNGHQIAWGRIGSGEPLILLHGTPFSSQVWRRVAPHMAAYRTVYYFDLLGYGQSAMISGGDVSLGVQNGLFVSLLKEWGVSCPDVVAHDFGGTTALRAHYLQSTVYRSLTLIDPVAVAPWGSALVQHVRAHEAAFGGAPVYIHEAILRAYLQSAAENPISPAALRIYMEPWLGKVGQSAFYRQIAQMDQKFTDEIEARYAALSFPITILWGEEDRWIPLESGQRLARALTGGNLTVVPAAGHLMQEDAPEAILAAVMPRLVE